MFTLHSPLYNFQAKSLRIGQAQIAYYVKGNGPALVFLHGLSGSSRWWARNAPQFSRNFRVYVVDIIGFGRSRGQAFTLQDAPDLILTWMDALHEDNFSLIGHSMGGYIAATIASMSKSVDHLILVDALALPLGKTVIHSARDLLAELIIMPKDLYPILANDAMRAGPYTLLQAIRDIHQEDLRVDLEKIKTHSLVLWGENDHLLPVLFGEELHRAIASSKFVVIKEAGHVVMWDQAGEFNRQVAGFLLG